MVLLDSSSTFVIPTGFAFDNTTKVSEVHFISHTHAILQAGGAQEGQRRLSVDSAIGVRAGAPTVVMEGLIIHSRLAIAGGNLRVRNCSFPGGTAAMDGGAITMTGGVLDVLLSSFIGNHAARHGGAVHLAGGRAGFSECHFHANTAGGRGGGISVTGGTLSLGEGTLLQGNTATGGGHSMHIASGASAAYHLPAPHGRWIYSTSLSYESLTGAVDGEYPFPCAPQCAPVSLLLHSTSVRDWPSHSAR